MHWFMYIFIHVLLYFVMCYFFKYLITLGLRTEGHEHVDMK